MKWCLSPTDCQWWPAHRPWSAIRTRITPVNDSVDVSFWIAGTDFVPRLRLKKDRLARATADEVARIA